jgi:hypothetical protein
VWLSIAAILGHQLLANLHWQRSGSMMIPCQGLLNVVSSSKPLRCPTIAAAREVSATAGNHAGAGSQHGHDSATGLKEAHVRLVPTERVSDIHRAHAKGSADFRKRASIKLQRRFDAAGLLVGPAASDPKKAWPWPPYIARSAAARLSAGHSLRVLTRSMLM